MGRNSPAGRLPRRGHRFMEQMEAGSINIDAEAVAASENVALSLGITLDREGCCIMPN